MCRLSVSCMIAAQGLVGRHLFCHAWSAVPQAAHPVDETIWVFGVAIRYHLEVKALAHKVWEPIGAVVLALNPLVDL